MKINRFLLFVLLFLSIPALVVSRDAKHADLVLSNCTVITMNEAQPEAQAVAIAGEKILFVGDETEAKKYVGPATRQLDLKGAFVYPGLIDSHAHIVSLGESRMQVDVVNTPDKESVLQKVAEKTRNTKRGEWILGRGWDQNDWPVKQFPHASDLDRVSSDHPVMLERIDGHAVWVNSLALKQARITAETKDPSGGQIIRDEQGNPTGVLIDNAIELVSSKIPAPSAERLDQALNLAVQEALRKGLTMVHEPGIGAATVAALKRAADNDRLPIRIYGMVAYPGDYAANYLSNGPEQHGPYLNIRGLKIVMDGAMGSRGAAMLEPYRDDPENRGLILLPPEEFVNVLRKAKAKDIQPGVHAIGDRANKLVLDSFAEVDAKGLRWRIEHAQLLAPQDIPRFASLGVVASMQPIHATSDMPWAQDRVGPERIAGAYAWRSLLKHNTVIAGGSDAPVEDINPLWGIYAAITRQSHDGTPAGGWLPEQRVSPYEALKMFTLDAAYSTFQEKELGSIERGKLADLIVLPENLLECNPEKMIDMKVLYTIVGGQVRYGKGAE